MILHIVRPKKTIISTKPTVKALKTSKLIVTQLCQQFHMFRSTHTLLLYSRTLQLITDLSQMKSVHTLPFYFFNILPYFSFAQMFEGISFLQVFKGKLCISHLYHAWYMSFELICRDLTILLKGWMEQGICEDHTVQIYIKEMYGIIQNRMVQPDTGRCQEEGCL